ncbi:MAG TPA: OpcA/G6PD domain-containing protein, partial [Pyrinomonadaceae bacterium]|nr:OpcA/G6PD domain-containing protein [Pyrinomonadaceae bacterium]
KYRQYILASDLNWGRLTAWRNLIASFWDVADYREHLNGIDGIVIEYDPPDESKGEVAAQALLVAGWLASRLKWQVGGEFQRDAGGVRWTLGAGGGREIALEMRATADRHDCDGLIASLTLKASGAEFYAAVNQEWTKLETSAKIGDAQKVGRVVAYEAKSEGQRLSRELGLLTRDAVYEESVATASRLIEALKKS